MTVQKLVVGFLRTNCYILFDREEKIAAVIDPGGDAGRILAFLKEQELSLKDIYLTHSHFDHMLAAAPLRDATGARVVVHTLEEKGLLSAAPARYISIAPEPFRVCPPDVRLVGGERTRLGEHEITFLHTPGHSPGSLCIFCENYLFSGDTLMAGTCGRFDLPGGNEDDMYRSLRELYSLPRDYILYPGHGETSTLGIERADNPAMHMALLK